jgi:phosphoglycerate dehydrogenase-like enzyme
MAILATPRRGAAYQVGIFVSGDGTRGVPYRESLAGKTVAVVGLAKSGVAAARLLRRLGARVLASDSGALETLTAEARALDREGYTLWTGGHP